MRLTKNINGKHLEMTVAEDTATRAEWAENELKARMRALEPTVEERLVAMQVEINELKTRIK